MSDLVAWYGLGVLSGVVLAIIYAGWLESRLDKKYAWWPLTAHHPDTAIIHVDTTVATNDTTQIYCDLPQTHTD